MIVAWLNLDTQDLEIDKMMLCGKKIKKQSWCFCYIQEFNVKKQPT